jgi:hypothetical protein
MQVPRGVLNGVRIHAEAGDGDEVRFCTGNLSATKSPFSPNGAGFDIPGRVSPG